MQWIPRLPRRALLISACLGPALVACTSGKDEGDAQPATAPSDDSPQPSDGGSGNMSGADGAAVTAELRWSRASVVVGVQPLVRSSSCLVLTMDVRVDDPDGELEHEMVRELEHFWGGSTVEDLERPWLGVRLLDLAGDMVASPAMDDTGRTAAVRTEADGDDPAAYTEGTVQIAFSDMDGSELALFLPKVGIVEGVPIVDGEVPELGDSATALDLSAVADAPVTPIVTHAFDLTAPIEQQQDQETTTVNIGSDVLFDSSSAELSGEAVDVLDNAAARLTAHEPGKVLVIGHTDDVDTEEFNQDLSERRAQAVADALSSRIDTAAYPLSTEGRGESSPIADNSTDDGRARNRRVELLVSTPVASDGAAGPSSEPAPFEGPTARAEEGILLDQRSGREVLVRATRARMVDDHLVVTLEAVMQDEDAEELTPGLDGLSATPDPRDDLMLGDSHGGLAVLSGNSIVLPALHRLEEDEGASLRPMTDLNPNARLAGGVPRTLEVLYPRGIEGVESGASVTLQLGTDGFRLTDIAVE